MGFDSSVRRSKQSALPIMDIEELVDAMKEKSVRAPLQILQVNSSQLID